MRVLPGRKNGIKVIVIKMYLWAAEFWKQRPVREKNMPDVVTGGSGVLGHWQLLREFKGNLGYIIKPCLHTKTKHDGFGMGSLQLKKIQNQLL